jgi:Zn finger protein HypA/HybF involved in hydrogenase expression
MHELSLALEVCRVAEAVLDHERGTAIRAIGVEIGPDAGVELENFRFCLETLLLEPPFAGARAELVPAGGETLRVSYVEIDDGHPDN